MSNTPDIQPPTIDRGVLGDLPPTMEWVGGSDGTLNLIDQTLLPLKTRILACTTAEEVWEAIRMLRVRGAPAIGVAAAYGLCLGTRPYCDQPRDAFMEKVRSVGDYLCGCRPTAVNLSWAIRRMTQLSEATR